MSDRSVRRWLIGTVLVTTLLPLTAACYFFDRALQTSLNIGFSPHITEVLDADSASLKRLKQLDPDNEAVYKNRFERVQQVQQIYVDPEWVKRSIFGPLRFYFVAGVVASILLSCAVAVWLGRRISGSYLTTFAELVAEREKSHQLKSMSSWQELARLLAHEIKNPLTPIEILVTGLTKSHEKNPPADFANELRQAQGIVLEEINHLKRIVARFSDFARVTITSLTEIDLVTALQSLMPAFLAMFQNVDIHLEVTSPERPLRVKIDLSLIRQVIVNIVANGVEANPNRRVTFRIGLQETDAIIAIHIANDGALVASEIAARMFEPYISGTAGAGNMGLGLTIVRKIAIEHGGDISYSEHAGLPTFTLKLPRVV